MKSQLFLLASLCLTLTACKDNQPTQPPAADNTARNARDRNGQTLTPINQPENEMDRLVTQKIRQALMEDDSLSTNAKNVKIVTINGVVTLRGPVNDERERSEVLRKAQLTNGVRRIDNQLETIFDSHNR